MNKEYQEKKKNELIQQIINHSIQGESYIISSAGTHWKRVVLSHFNKIYRKEMNLEELLIVLQKSGIKFTQKNDIIRYTIKELLIYIGNVSKKKVEFD